MINFKVCCEKACDEISVQDVTGKLSRHNKYGWGKKNLLPKDARIIIRVTNLSTGMDLQSRVYEAVEVDGCYKYPLLNPADGLYVVSATVESTVTNEPVSTASCHLLYLDKTLCCILDQLDCGKLSDRALANYNMLKVTKDYFDHCGGNVKEIEGNVNHLIKTCKC